jgi:hypothetical protein
MLIVKLRSREHLLTGTYASRRRGSPKRYRLSIQILKFKYETSLKLKINYIGEYLGLAIYPIKPSAGLFFIIKSRETIPLYKNPIKFKFKLKFQLF